MLLFVLLYLIFVSITTASWLHTTTTYVSVHEYTFVRAISVTFFVPANVYSQQSPLQYQTINMEASLARLVRLQRRLSYLLHKIIHPSSPVPSVYYSAASPASSTRSLNVQSILDVLTLPSTHNTQQPPACLEKTFSALRTADDAGEPLLNKMAYFISHLTLREVVVRS